MTEAILWSNDSIHNGQNWTSAIYPTTRYEIPHVMSPIQIIFLTIYILLALIGIIGNIVVICGLCVGCSLMGV